MSYKVLASVLALFVAVGCSSQPKPTAREEIKSKWNNARAGVLYSLGKQQYENGHFDACRKSINEGLAHNADHVPLRLLSARLSIEQGQLEQADRELQQARALEPKNGEVDYLAGVIAQRWQRNDSALAYYTRACEKAPAELPYVLARAEMLVAVDRRAEALALLLDKMAYFENSATIRDAVGQLLSQDGKHAEAVMQLRHASILAPDEQGIREHLALATYYARDYREAAHIIERLMADEKYAARADLLSALGECRMQLGLFREARESFETAAQRDPSSPAIWLNLAKAAIQTDDEGRVNLSLRKAMSLDPANAEAYLMQGYLRIRQNRLNDALSSFRKASLLDPKDPVILCMTGYVLEKQGLHEQAIEHYGRALQLRPGDEMASMLMAQVETGE